MTTPPIKNPYVVIKSMYRNQTNVMWRYLLKKEIKFKFICTTMDRKTADKIAKLLNENVGEV